MEKLSPESFGRGSFVGEISKDSSPFDQLSEKEQAEMVGWYCGCPMAEELVRDRGPEAMIKRYGEINFWFGHILKEAEKLNKPLADELAAKAKRNDPVGKYESTSVPEYYLEEMAPINKLACFSVSRIFVEQLYAGEEEKDKIQERFLKGSDTLEESIKDSKNPMELMVRFGEEVSKLDAKPEKVLGHILGKGWLEQHNDHQMVADAKRALEEFAPSLWETYCNLSDEQKAEKGLV